MNSYKLLFDSDGKAKTPTEVKNKIAHFGYTAASFNTICDSKELDREGKVFIKCAARILSSFGMTRSGPFKDIKHKAILQDCWNAMGDRIWEIHNSIHKSGYSRDRYLLEIGDMECEELIAKIWSITKQLLPFTMGRTSYGLVGASKILFAVLPEIVLPVDNAMCLKLFKTVDLGDVLRSMVMEIQRWEKETGEKLNEMDPQKRLTTLPSVYNVMAMDARLKKDIVSHTL
jgi:hypothetical protein